MAAGRDTPDRRDGTGRRGGVDRRGDADQGTGGSGRSSTGGRTGAGGAGAAARSDARGAGQPTRGAMSEARRYTPRARTVREGSGRGDPFRPAFEVLEGGRADAGRRTGRAQQPPRTAGGTSADERGTARDRTRTTKPDGGPAAQPARTPAARTPAARTPAARTPTARNPSARTPAGKTARDTKPASGGRATTAKTAAKSTTRIPAKQPARKSAARPTRRVSRVRVPLRLGRPPGPPRLGEPRRRLRLATVLALAMFAVIAGRLVVVQLTDARAYAAQGLRDRLRTEDLPAPRGAILDRGGNILVHSVEARYVWADPMQIVDPEAAADRLFGLLGDYGVLRSDLVRRLTPHKTANGKNDVRFEYLARGVDIGDAEQVKALGLRGVYIARDERRDIPGNELASNVIGFTSSGDHKGRAGVELSYDDVLKGIDGTRTFEIGDGDLATEIPGSEIEYKPARKGSSVELTIDRDLQYSVQRTLFERMQPLGASFATAIVLDARSGEVVAQASYPSFEAANPGRSDPGLLKDQCTQTVYDPGSVHKAIVVGAALQEGLLRPDEVIVVESKVVKGDTEYRGHQKDGTPLTVPGILALSDNPGTIKIADRLGKEKLYEYQRKFGLGERTGVGLPGEAAGALLPPNRWSGSSPGSIPIGNGVAVTSMQMAAAYAAIANDGVWIQPHLVRRTIGPDGKVTTPPAPKSHRVLDANHAAELRTMLEGVVTLDKATGTQARIDGYRIAGKTGTSKLPQDGGYAPGDVVSFIGMAPADAPRYVVAVTAHVPKGGGGSTAAPAFKDMMAYTLARFGVLPTGTEPPALKIHP